MARFNEILVGRYNRCIQKLFSMKGPSSLVTVADEMMPVLQFFHGVENRYLEAWNRFGASIGVAGVAAVTSAWRMRNPAGSNVTAVVELMTIQSAVVDTNLTLFHGTTTLDLTSVAALSLTRMDPRGNPQPIMQISSGTSQPGLPSSAAYWSAPFGAQGFLNVIFTQNQEITILPGDALQIQTSAVNDTLTVSVFWRERFLEDSERT